jgi:hypothetical protein
MFNRLPEQVQRAAKKNFELLKSDPQHPSLHLKKIGDMWSVRAGLQYRALGTDVGNEEVLWFWIGSHADYDRFIEA